MSACHKPPSTFRYNSPRSVSPIIAIAILGEEELPNRQKASQPSTFLPRDFNPISLAATIQKGDGEIEALQAAMGRVEATLAVERTRAAAMRESARRDAKERAEQTAQMQSMAGKLAEEKSRRKKLREELASAAENLKMSLEKNVALAAALSACQQASEDTNGNLILKTCELSRAKEKILELQEELYTCREALEKGKKRTMTVFLLSKMNI